MSRPPLPLISLAVLAVLVAGVALHRSTPKITEPPPGQRIETTPPPTSSPPPEGPPMDRQAREPTGTPSERALSTTTTAAPTSAAHITTTAPRGRLPTVSLPGPPLGITVALP